MKKATRATAFKFLRNHTTAVLATISKHGDLSTTPITFTVTGNRRIRFATKNKTTKYVDIINNNKVALSVVSLKEVTAVNINGSASIVEDPAEMIETLRLVGGASRRKEYSPVIKHQRGNFVVIEIIPEKIQYTNFSADAEDQFTDYIYNL